MSQPRKYPDHAARQAAYRARSEQARQGELAAKGLPALPALPSIPGWPRWNAIYRMAHALMEGAVGEQWDYYEDRSERWKESERGEDHQERIAAAEEAVDVVSGLIR